MMSLSKSICSLTCVLSLSAVVADSVIADDDVGIKVPDGFRVELFADDDLAHDIHSLTFNSIGQLVVSGPGYVRTLLDTDEDGVADKVRVFADAPKTGAQGMFFLGRHLLCSGDAGLQMFRDDNRDGKADGDPEIFLRVAAGREHDVHAIRKGPDGWWYVIAGNMAGVTGAYATVETSPVKQPQSGTLLRLKPDLSGGEILADGFRNAYDFDFNAAGDIFTFDSDGERDITLPWYRPTRVFQVTPRSHAGWITRGWKRPDYFPDMPPVVGSFGRGSPSGVVCYRHTQFPKEYHGAIFGLDWTYGRIWALPLRREGAVWLSTPFEFASATGQLGFAPTDAEVSPDGSLYVSIGGRGTRGGVYRIFRDPSEDESDDTETDLNDLLRVLRAVQPGSSWSRAKWIPQAKTLGGNAFIAAALNEDLTSADRVRAVEVLTELFEVQDPTVAARLARSPDTAVRARAAWSVGRWHAAEPPAELIRDLLNDREPTVVRAALEALTTATEAADLSPCLAALAATLSSDDRYIRSAAAAVMTRLDEKEWMAVQRLVTSNRVAQVAAHMGRVARSAEFNSPALNMGLAMLTDKRRRESEKLDAVRLMQLALADTGPNLSRPSVFDCCASRIDLTEHDRELDPARAAVAAIYPTGSPKLDQELLRLIGMLAPPNRELLPVLLKELTFDSHPTEDISRLIVLARLAVERTTAESTATAAALVGLDVKIDELRLPQDANWDDRMRELYHALCEVDPAIRDVIVDQPGFGMPGHVLFLSEIPKDRVPTAIEHFVRQIEANEDFVWTNDVVFAIGESKEAEHQALLREQLDNLAVRGAVLMTLAEDPQADDRSLFVEGLSSGSFNVVQACLTALKQLPPSRDSAEQFALLAAARRLMNSPAEFAARESALRLLQNNTSQSFDFVFDAEGYRPQPEPLRKWGDWLRENYPDFQPADPTGSDTARLLELLGDVDWEAGDAERGEALFRKLACAKCHGGRQALGPDLQGVAKRFSTQDLFAAIVDPNRDVSPQYQTTSVLTKDGDIHTGLIVYESVDGLLLRDGENRTWRIEAADIDARQQDAQSLMPGGLLKDQSQEDFADLNAWLKGL